MENLANNLFKKDAINFGSFFLPVVVFLFLAISWVGATIFLRNHDISNPYVVVSFEDLIPLAIVGWIVIFLSALAIYFAYILLSGLITAIISSSTILSFKIFNRDAGGIVRTIIVILQFIFLLLVIIDIFYRHSDSPLFTQYVVKGISLIANNREFSVNAQILPYVLFLIFFLPTICTIYTMLTTNDSMILKGLSAVIVGIIVCVSPALGVYYYLSNPTWDSNWPSYQSDKCKDYDLKTVSNVEAQLIWGGHNKIVIRCHYSFKGKKDRLKTHIVSPENLDIIDPGHKRGANHAK